MNSRTWEMEWDAEDKKPNKRKNFMSCELTDAPADGCRWATHNWELLRAIFNNRSRLSAALETNNIRRGELGL
ncbi:hypothetical protein J1614_001134 [Plenodomus biglobosus]|nr:hypothetical protein J1614_001134 [Plenodomus biglobosus]